MTRFIDLSTKNPSSFGKVAATLFIVLLVYFMGGSGLLFDFLQTSSSPVVEKNVPMSDFIDVLGNNRVLFWLLLPFVLVFFTFLGAVKWIHKRKIGSFFTGREYFDWSRVFTSFFLLFVVLSVTTGFQIFATESFQWNFHPDKFIFLLIIAVIMIPIQTTIEELLFRGYLMQGLKTKLSSGKYAVVLSGIFFGLIHFWNPEIEAIGYHVLIYYVGTGVFLGCLALFDNGLELSVGYHAANNIFAALFVSNDWQVFQTDALYIDHAPPGLSWLSLIFGLLIFVAMLLFFRKRYGWKNMKEYWA